ncbi:MAG: CDP-diacylglycerol--glycerol-3-phosphate 3-phosphatidyltransferase [Chlamydiales bacterium]
MTLANSLTFIRIFISPIFLLIYVQFPLFHIHPQVVPFILLFLLSVSELSDLFDGYFARKFHQVTDLGKILDPMADSIARISVFLTFTLEPVKIPLLLVFPFLYRDSVISTLRTICALKGFALAARPSGKTKAVIQGIAAMSVVVLMIPFTMGLISNDTLTGSSTVLVGIAAIYTVYSGIEYLYSNRHYLKLLLSKKSSVSQSQT